MSEMQPAEDSSNDESTRQIVNTRISIARCFCKTDVGVSSCVRRVWTSCSSELLGVSVKPPGIESGTSSGNVSDGAGPAGANLIFQYRWII